MTRPLSDYFAGVLECKIELAIHHGRTIILSWEIAREIANALRRKSRRLTGGRRRSRI